MGDEVMTDDKMRVTAKVLKLKVESLKEQLKKFKVRVPQGLKADLQTHLTEHLSANAEDRAEFLADVQLEASHEFLKGYCRNDHIMAQVMRAHIYLLPSNNDLYVLPI